MDKSKVIKIALLACAAFCLIAAVSLFAEGDIASGACGLALAAALGVGGLRKRRTAGTHSGQETPAPPSYAKTHKVYIEKGGKRYHSNGKCSGMKKPKYVTLEYALKKGYTECKKCSGTERERPPAFPGSAPRVEAEKKETEYEFLRVKVAGVTFKNGRKSRQTILRKIHFKDAPFDSNIEATLQREEFEGAPAFGVFINDEQIGYIPAEHVQYIQDNFTRCDGITHIEVYGGGEGRNYGAEITLRFRKE